MYGVLYLDWNLSKSAQILGGLTLHIKSKFQNKTKIKLHKILIPWCRHFSLASFWQVKYIIKKRNLRKKCFKND